MSKVPDSPSEPCNIQRPSWETVALARWVAFGSACADKSWGDPVAVKDDEAFGEEVFGLGTFELLCGMERPGHLQ